MPPFEIARFAVEQEPREDAQHLGSVVGIRRVVAGEPRSANAWLATERVDVEARVVADCRQPRGRQTDAAFNRALAEQCSASSRRQHICRPRDQLDQPSSIAAISATLSGFADAQTYRSTRPRSVRSDRACETLEAEAISSGLQLMISATPPSASASA